MPMIKQLFGANFHFGTVGKLNRKSKPTQNHIGDGNQALQNVINS
jgi:hypothetical protein